MSPTKFLAIVPVTMFAACAGAPVRVAPGYGPSQPTPTLAASVVYEFDMEEREIDDLLSPFASGDGNALLSNIAFGVESMSAMDVFEAAGPALAQHAFAYLERQGFAVEEDASRAAKLQDMAQMWDSRVLYEMPGTSARTFHDLPVFGSPNVEGIVGAVATSRDREAYASVFAMFSASGNDFGNGANCRVFLRVYDKSQQLVFSADGAKFTAGRSGQAPQKILEQAFKATLDSLPAAVVDES